MRPLRAAKGSHVESWCGSSSTLAATSAATSCPCSDAMSATAMSMPAATPDDVHRSRSSTQRARASQWTFGPCRTAQANARLLEVAR